MFILKIVYTAFCFSGANVEKLCGLYQILSKKTFVFLQIGTQK